MQWEVDKFNKKNGKLIITLIFMNDQIIDFSRISFVSVQ